MDEKIKDSIPDRIISKNKGVVCPYLGNEPLRLLCYYIIIKLHRSEIKPRPEKKIKQYTWYEKFETCMKCRAWPGKIWKKKKFGKMVFRIVAGIFGSIKHRGSSRLSRIRGVRFRERKGKEAYNKYNREACKKYRDKQKDEYNQYMREYMRKKYKST